MSKIEISLILQFLSLVWKKEKTTTVKQLMIIDGEKQFDQNVINYHGQSFQTKVSATFGGMQWRPMHNIWS